MSFVEKRSWVFLGVTAATYLAYVAMILGTPVSIGRRNLLRDTLTDGSGLFDPANLNQGTRLRTMISHLLGSPEFIKQ